MNRATLLLHGGRAPVAAGDPIVPPVAQSVNYAMPVGPDDIVYSGSGNTPSSTTIQQRLALLEGTEAAIVLSSGTAATAATLLALLRSGDHLVASSWLYGGTQEWMQQELPAIGIEVTFIDPTETRAWRRSLRRNTRVLFLESPVNPTLRVVDMRPAKTLAQEHGIALVVDATFASPINCRPVEHGADVVIHSATKYLNGHHDVLAGVVCGSDALIEEVRQKMVRWGSAPDPFALWLLERGLKTLDVRMHRHNANALAIAQWAVVHPAFSAVHYPGLTQHPDHEYARDTMDGFGGMLAVVLHGGGEAAARMLSRTRVFHHAPSLGGVDSLACEPRFTSHRHLAASEREALGIPDGFVRLSVGIEHVDDLIADLAQAVDV